MNAYEFILETERDALGFYEAMAQEARDPGVRAIFAMMAKDERELCRRLEGWWERAGRELKDSPTLEGFRRNRPAGWAAESVSDVVRSDLDAYRLVMEMDEERARTYETAATFETDPNAQDLLRAAALQDYRHHDGVESLLDFVSAPQYHLAWQEFSNLGEFKNFGRDPI